MSQKNKNILLIAGFILTIIMSYYLSFSKTIAVKKELTKLESKNISFESLANLSATIKQREFFADSILKKNNLKNTSLQNNLLAFLNSNISSNNYIIDGFLQPHTALSGETLITSYQFTLQGDFDELEKVIYSLEQEYNFGTIAHISYEKKRDFRKRKNYLQCLVIIENVSSGK